MNTQLKATLLVTLSGILYGFMGYLGIKIIAEHLSVSCMLFWRFFIAMLWILFTIAILQKKRTSIPTNKKNLLKTISLGVFSYSGSSGFYFLATHYLATGLAMVIFFCYPMFVAMFAWLFTSWKITRYAIASLVAIFIGLILLKGEGSHAINFTGIFLAMLSGLSYAIYVYSNRHSSEKIEALPLTLFICLGNSLVFLFFSLFTHSFLIPTSMHAWFYMLALGIFATAVPIQLLLIGLKHISPIKVSIISVLEPAVTVLIGFVLLSEAMTVAQFLGIIIVLAGAVLIQFEKQTI